MHTIWKYKLDVTDTVIVQMPVDAKILSVQSQDGDIILWTLVNPNNTVENRTFRIYGTGNPVSDSLVYNKSLVFIDTVQLFDGQLVYHVFETK